MHLPIKIASTHHVSEVIELYSVFNRFSNFGKLRELQSYFTNNVDNDSYKCYEYYRIDSIRSCVDSIVFIDSFKEGWHVLRGPSKQWPKDKHYFILSAADWDTNDPQYQLPINYTLLYFPWVLFDIARAYSSFKHELFFSDITYNFDYPKKISFCSMSSSIKSHRRYIVEKLLPRLRPLTYAVKHEGKNLGLNIEHLDIVKNEADPYHYHHSANELFKTTLGRELQVTSWQHMPIDIYNISYYNLITESNQQGKHFFPTEKIFKPIIAGIPFVCISTQNFLKRIQDLGFKTYDTIWDESYDEEPDDQLRLELVADLCVKLENFDWQAHRHKLVEIAWYNRKQWTNLSSIFANCFKSMENNIAEFKNCNI